VTGTSGGSGTTYAGFLTMTAPLGTNQTFNGAYVVLTCGEALALGDVAYFKSDGKAWKANAGTVTTMPGFGLTVVAGTAAGVGTFLLHGFYRDDARYNWTIGGYLYMSATAGYLSQTQPVTTDGVVQVMGLAIPDADTVYFNPTLMYFTHT
jgi:hypothetical protein